jgi:hypothetical protein
VTEDIPNKPTNPAVTQAYKDGGYTDKNGQVWSRGMDGWFCEISKDTSMLIRHHDFVSIIEKENPE